MWPISGPILIHASLGVFFRVSVLIYNGSTYWLTALEQGQLLLLQKFNRSSRQTCLPMLLKEVKYSPLSSERNDEIGMDFVMYLSVMVCGKKNKFFFFWWKNPFFDGKILCGEYLCSY